MKIIGLLILFLISTFSFSQGRVDGFLKGKGNLDIAVSAFYEANSKYYAGTNLIKLRRDITGTSAFAAYGITNNLDLNVSLPFLSINGKESGLQDGAIYLKYRLSRTRLYLRRDKDLKMNSSSNNDPVIDLFLAGGFSSNFTNYQTQGGDALGQQAKAIDIRPVIQVYLPQGVFATIQTGFIYKFDPVPNAFPLALKIGIAKAKFYADIWYDYQNSFGGIDYPTSDTFRKIGVDYHKIGCTFYKPINNKFGAFGGLSYVLTGRNSSKGIGINAGVVYKPDLKKN